MIELGSSFTSVNLAFSNSAKKLVFRTFFSNANNSQFVNILFFSATLRAVFMSIYFSPLFYAVGGKSWFLFNVSEGRWFMLSLQI